MKKTTTFSSILNFIVLFIHFIRNSKALTIDLIHHFSPESPFHKPNITSLKMIKTFNVNSITHKKYYTTIFSDHTFRNMSVIQPKLVFAAGGGYLAKLNLGNFPNEQPSYKTYYFHFDTGSYLTWLQCEDCNKSGGQCFHQNGSPYPNRRSATYAPLHCNKHRFCIHNQCRNQYCTYNVTYVDHTRSFGILAYETLTFDSTCSRHAHARIVIGCGISNDMKLLGSYINEAGVLGMGWGAHSFVNQIFPYSHGRFSYCLPPVVFNGFGGHSTVLRFGNDIRFDHSLSSLSIQRYKHSYSVNLRGISINNKRLNITDESIVNKSSSRDECIFDTGTTYSFIPRKAFRVLKEEMIRYVTSVDKRLNVSEGGALGFHLCFVKYQPFTGYNHLPSITFHFDEGVKLVQESDVAFTMFSKTNEKHYCMGIFPSFDQDNVAIIGSQFQANHVFVFDQLAKRVYFGPRNCTRNP